MDIAAALTSSAPISDRRCLLRRQLDTIPDTNADKGALLDAIEDAQTYPAPRVGRIMEAIGLPVSLSIIRMHRAGTCSCYLAG